MAKSLTSILALLVQLIGAVILVMVMPVLAWLGLAGHVNNCWWYAEDRRRREGGYVVQSPSRYGWWYHYFWTRDFIVCAEWTTDAKYRRWCPPLIFPGHVRIFYLPCVIRPEIPHVPIPAYHLKAAQHARLLLRPVPLNDCEKMPDPDYGL